MKEWKEYKLREITTMKNGKKRPKENGSYPVYGGNGIMDYADNYNAENVIIVGRVGAYCGNVFKCDDKCWVSDNAISVFAKDTINKDFLYYLMCTLDLHHHHIGAAQPLMTQDIIGNFDVYIPSLPTQQKIANILSSLADKIEVNRRINEQLEELAGALFKSWFVDFEPFKDGEFVDSELGMIPKGWKVGKLGEYCKVKSGFAFKSSWWQDNGLKVIKIKNITSDGVLDMNDCSYVSSENTLKAKDFKTNVGDLLIAMTGATIGKFCIISSREEMYVNQRVGKFFLGNNPIIKLPFIYCTLKTERVYSEIVNKGQGSAQPNISGSDIENIHIPMPLNIDLLSLFHGKLKSVFEKMIHNQQEIHHLTTLRDTLLPKLMSGEIDVNEVEI